MAKLINLIFLLLLLPANWLRGDTFFLYASENYANQAISLEESAREGVLEEFFEAGHIIFDDISQKKYEIPALLDQACQYGADFLIVLDIASFENMMEREKILSTASFFLYDVQKTAIVGQGSLEQDNSAGNTLLSRAQFWYSLGKTIAGELEGFYTRYRLGNY